MLPDFSGPTHASRLDFVRFIKMGTRLSGMFGSEGGSFAQNVGVPENLFGRVSYWMLFIFASDQTKPDDSKITDNAIPISFLNYY